MHIIVLFHKVESPQLEYSQILTFRIGEPLLKDGIPHWILDTHELDKVAVPDLPFGWALLKIVLHGFT